MPTREVYQVNQQTGKSTYAGYARFGADGSFQGTAGGYGRNGQGRGASNSATRGASRVQNTISTVGARQARRRPRGL